MRRLYNGKWDGIWDKPKYQEMRFKIKDAFKDLIFEEGPHKYYLNGQELTCVSNVTHMFKEEFDTEGAAQGTYERNFNNPNSQYYQMSVDEIIDSWKKNSEHACEHGTERHNFAESCFYFSLGLYDGIVPEFKDRLHQDEDGKYYFEAIYAKEEAVVKFWEDLPLCFVPIAAENKIYRLDLGYSGTFDLLCYYDAEIDGKDPSKSGLVVMDWKTNKDLYKNYNNKVLLAPFSELLDMPLSIYKLQLSLYELGLENIGLKVIARRLMWLKPNATYEKIPLESYTRVLYKTLLENKLK